MAMKSQSYEISASIPTGLPESQVGGDHILHRHTHRFVDSDFIVTLATGLLPKNYRSESRSLGAVKVGEFATPNWGWLKSIEGLDKEAMIFRQIFRQLSVRRVKSNRGDVRASLHP
jgi:hypothetical protein